MSDIVAERFGNILSIQLNRPAKKNAMTSSMYVTMADLLNGAAKDDQIRVVLWHAAGNSFSAGNDIEDFMQNPPAPGESPQAQLIHALINFEKPLVAAVRGAAGLDREAIRKSAVARFDRDRMVDDYLAAYARVLGPAA